MEDNWFLIIFPGKFISNINDVLIKIGLSL